MKAGREHIAPLCTGAMQFLMRCKRLRTNDTNRLFQVAGVHNRYGEVDVPGIRNDQRWALCRHDRWLQAAVR